MAVVEQIMGLSLTWEFNCDAPNCGFKEDVYWDVALGANVPHPELPEGWFVGGYRFFCPKHTLKHIVDGHEVDGVMFSGFTRLVR